jgi:hypothetical protein
MYTRNLGFRVDGGADPFAPRGMKQNDAYNNYYRNYNAYNQFVGQNPGAANMNLFGNHDPTTMKWSQLQNVMNRRYDRMGQQPPGPLPHIDPPMGGRVPAPAPGGIGNPNGRMMGGMGAPSPMNMAGGIEPFIRRILGM